jgi:hypothetical protein
VVQSGDDHTCIGASLALVWYVHNQGGYGNAPPESVFGTNFCHTLYIDYIKRAYLSTSCSSSLSMNYHRLHSTII